MLNRPCTRIPSQRTSGSIRHQGPPSARARWRASPRMPVRTPLGMGALAAAEWRLAGKAIGTFQEVVGAFVARGKGQRGAPNANQLPTNLIMMKGLDVLGCPTVISTVQDPSLRGPRLAQVLAWAASGALVPHVSHTFPLAEFATAMRAKWSGEIIGGCVLHP